MPVIGFLNGGSPPAAPYAAAFRQGLAGRDRRTLVKVISGLQHARVAGSEVWLVSSRDCVVLSGVI
jgi:hypothetical protein